MKQVVAVALAASLMLSSTPVAFAQSAPTPGSRVTRPGGDPWPRTVNANGAAISIFQPQLNTWTGNLLDAYAVVTIKVASSDVTNYV